MAKKRIHQIAKELDIASADVLFHAKELGFEVKTASSGLTEEEEELLKLELSGGGKVIMLSDYLKQKRKPPIKKIDLAQGDFEKTVTGLSSADKDIIKDLLRKSGIKVSD